MRFLNSSLRPRINTLLELGQFRFLHSTLQLRRRSSCSGPFFRGREDVYPRRFESRKTGRAGYQPACGNEWVRGVCEKPKIKCSECLHQRFLAVTDDVIRWHLSGKDPYGNAFVAGVYPLLADETCWFLAIDLDKEDWQQDVRAVRDTCERIGLSVVVERSRSGNGAHVWMFFEGPIPARLARNLGSHVLTETMESRPDLGLRSYDRLFPNQDTLPIRASMHSPRCCTKRLRVCVDTKPATTSPIHTARRQ
jgi:hypothetical protein